MNDIRDIIKEKFGELTEAELTFGEACYTLGQQNIADFLDAEIEKKEERIKAKKKFFYDKLVPFVPTYGKEMIREFFNYWSEQNKSMTKLKWEMESTWDFNLRLQRWAGNNFNATKKATTTEPTQDRYKN